MKYWSQLLVLVFAVVVAGCSSHPTGPDLGPLGARATSGGLRTVPESCSVSRVDGWQRNVAGSTVTLLWSPCGSDFTYRIVIIRKVGGSQVLVVDTKGTGMQGSLLYWSWFMRESGPYSAKIQILNGSNGGTWSDWIDFNIEEADSGGSGDRNPPPNPNPGGSPTPAPEAGPGPIVPPDGGSSPGPVVPPPGNEGNKGGKGHPKKPYHGYW